ncbi:MAG TPA: hypothetical protein VK641_16820 [Terriglobales bacterium]|nr:hypothetical protein [Terriglobales bacterium]
MDFIRVKSKSKKKRSYTQATVPGLTAKDFEASARVPPRREHLPQSISWARLVRLAGPNGSAEDRTQLPSGIYGNRDAAPNLPAPPSILLGGGLSTDMRTQLRARQQMVLITQLGFRGCAGGYFFLKDRNLRLVQSPSPEA